MDENLFFKKKGPFKISKLFPDKNLDTNQEVKDIKSLDISTNSDISFFDSQKYRSQASITKASYCITNSKLQKYLSNKCKPIIVKNVLFELAKSLKKIYPDADIDYPDLSLKSPSKKSYNSVKFGNNVLIGKNVKIGNNTSIGHNTIIESNVIIGKNCEIGSNVILKKSIIGDYVKVEDNYKDIPVAYWVYPENEKEAFRSFGKTPDMLEFFNEITGFKYPFETYDQIIVSEFMWGGMENITLTHNTDRTMFDSKAHPDHSSDGLVAHELAHQWFGNLITTRNWANIWLNEGFATYLSRLYITKDRGVDEGDYVRLNEIKGFMRADKAKRRPTVDFNYEEPFELFSSHVYAKGSLILTMLQDVLGEDGFWRSIKDYIIKNKLKTVETVDLKKSIENTTGQNLDWFFNQWLYEPGFPEYEVSWNYNQRMKELSIHVKQVQDLKTTSLFKMPIRILIDNGKKEEHIIWVEDLDSVFKINSNKRPKMVIFNSGMRVPSILKTNKSVADLRYQLKNAPNALDRIWAVQELSKKKGRKIVEYALLECAQNDSFWAVRSEAYSSLSRLKSEYQTEDFDWIRTKEKDNRAKRSFIRSLRHQVKDLEVIKFLNNVIISDTSYYAIADAIRILSIVDSSSAKDHIDKLLSTESHNDVIRKSAISYFGQVISQSNYDTLKKMLEYGSFSWASRPTIVYQLARYQKKYPDTYKHILSYYDDNDRFVRMAVMASIGNYGSKTDFKKLDEMVEKDPVLSINAMRAKKKIDDRAGNKLQKSDSQIIDQLNKKIDAIKNILQD